MARELVVCSAVASRFEAVLPMAAKMGILPEEHDLDRIKATVGLVKVMAEAYQLSSTAHKCDRLSVILARVEYPATPQEISAELKDLLERLEDDLRSAVFLHLQMNQAALYGDPLRDWGDVIARFPRMQSNIEESSKCYALERYGAAVFHVLQVAEYGVIKVSELLGVQGDKPGWGALERLEKIRKIPFPQRDALQQKHSSFIDAVVPLAVVVKDSWRHKLMHVDNQIVWEDTDFGPNVALEIIVATRGFIRKLATDLPC